MMQLGRPVVEQMAMVLTEGRGTQAQLLTIPTLLTQGNRSAGRDGVRVKPTCEAMPKAGCAPSVHGAWSGTRAAGPRPL